MFCGVVVKVLRGWNDCGDFFAMAAVPTMHEMAAESPTHVDKDSLILACWKFSI